MTQGPFPEQPGQPGGPGLGGTPQQPYAQDPYQQQPYQQQTYPNQPPYQHQQVGQTGWGPYPPGRPPGRRKGMWAAIIAVACAVVVAACVLGYFLLKPSAEDQARRDQAARTAAAAQYRPTEADHDPSRRIKGVLIKPYTARGHATPEQRVAYDVYPPMGGPHDGIWADCNGTVYTKPVRNENMVHTLEHGAVWIAYNPQKLDDAGRQSLAARVTGKSYTSLTPYPGLQTAVSVQSWGHRLQTDDPDDQRIDDFITALRQNPYTTPESNASCQAAPGFDVTNPPAFNPTPPTKGANTVPPTYNGTK